MSWLLPRRHTEATAEQLISSGAYGSGIGVVDPLDRDSGFRRVGGGPREVPAWTLERARAWSVAGYRTNPMARSIIDTYVAFMVGDSGVSLQCSHPEVREVAEAYWNDQRNQLGARQEPMARDHLLNGESVYENLVGERTGVTRFSVIDPARITEVVLDAGNPLWPTQLIIDQGGDGLTPTVVQRDDITGLRMGQVHLFQSNKALLTDRRGFPFLGPVLDDLDDYDQVLSNLVDRTALARYLVWDVTYEGGDETMIRKYLAERGGAAPKSGGIEAHNEKITWDAKTAQVGAYEDANTSKTILTSLAAGTGLSKVWLAEPEDAGRASAMSMAEPVRRRVGAVQNLFLGFDTEMVRFAIDQAIVAGRLPATVKIPVEGGGELEVPAAETCTVTGPQIAAADAKITAEVLLKLSQAFDKMIARGVMTPEAAKVATKKAWEDYMGVPYRAELDSTDADTDDVATYVDDQQRQLRSA